MNRARPGMAATIESMEATVTTRTTRMAWVPVTTNSNKPTGAARMTCPAEPMAELA